MNDAGIIKKASYWFATGAVLAVVLVFAQFLFSAHYLDGSHEDHLDIACEYNLVQLNTGAADVPLEPSLIEPALVLYRIERYENTVPSVKIALRAFASRAPPQSTES